MHRSVWSGSETTSESLHDLLDLLELLDEPAFTRWEVWAQPGPPRLGGPAAETKRAQPAPTKRAQPAPLRGGICLRLPAAGALLRAPSTGFDSTPRHAPGQRMPTAGPEPRHPARPDLLNE